MSLLLSDLFLLFEVILLEALELRVFQSFLDMEGQGYSVETIFTHSFIVKFDVEEHGLLVAQMEVVLQFVVKLDT